MKRREFIRLSACSAAAGVAGCATKPAIAPWTGKDKISAMLLHLGYNMWCEWLPDDVQKVAKINDRFVPNYTLRNKDAYQPIPEQTSPTTCTGAPGSGPITR